MSSATPVTPTGRVRPGVDLRSLTECIRDSARGGTNHVAGLCDTAPVRYRHQEWPQPGRLDSQPDLTIRIPCPPANLTADDQIRRAGARVADVHDQASRLRPPPSDPARHSIHPATTRLTAQSRCDPPHAAHPDGPEIHYGGTNFVCRTAHDGDGDRNSRAKRMNSVHVIRPIYSAINSR